MTLYAMVPPTRNLTGALWSTWSVVKPIAGSGLLVGVYEPWIIGSDLSDGPHGIPLVSAKASANQPPLIGPNCHVRMDFDKCRLTDVLSEQIESYIDNEISGGSHPCQVALGVGPSALINTDQETGIDRLHAETFFECCFHGHGVPADPCEFSR